MNEFKLFICAYIWVRVLVYSKHYPDIVTIAVDS
jgi:hypothetical protein